MIKSRNNKIQSQRALFKIVSRLKNRGEVIVTFNGSFDVLHVGHIRALKEAKAQGDVLIVLLNSDFSIKSYKGSSKPINPQRHRAEFLASLECVDYVTTFDEITPVKILGRLNPHIHCNGSDWGKYCIERKVVEKNSGRIYLTKWTKRQSTSQLLQKIVSTLQHPPARAVFLDRNGTINDDAGGYVYKREDFHFKPEVIRAFRQLSKSKYKIIITTNQSGIGRGYYTKIDLHKLHTWLVQIFSKKGVRIDKIYYCPHVSADRCKCRKPGIGMILQAQKEFDLDLSKSWIIGDNKTDILAGREANLKTIFFGTQDSKRWKDIRPHHQTSSLAKAVKITMAES